MLVSMDKTSLYRGSRWDFPFFQIWPVFGPVSVGFCTSKLGFFGFDDFCGLQVFSILVFGFRFLSKNDRGFSYFSAHYILHPAFSLRPSSDVVLLRCPN